LQCLPNQPGDARCYVSPARCAGSSFTSATRIARLIRRGCGLADMGNFRTAWSGWAPNQSEAVGEKVLTPKQSGAVIGLCDRASGWKARAHSRVRSDLLVSRVFSPRNRMRMTQSPRLTVLGSKLSRHPTRFGLPPGLPAPVVHESPLLANPQPRRISRAMRVAEVKEELAQRAGDT